MRPIAPRTGAPEITLAEEQLQYAPLVVACYVNAQTGELEALLSRWRLTDEERAAIAAGEDVYLAIVSPRHPPVSVMVGPGDWLAERCAPYPPEGAPDA